MEASITFVSACSCTINQYYISDFFMLGTFSYYEIYCVLSAKNWRKFILFMRQVRA